MVLDQIILILLINNILFSKATYDLKILSINIVGLFYFKAKSVFSKDLLSIYLHNLYIPDHFQSFSDIYYSFLYIYIYYIYLGNNNRE